ncbi:MAG: zf-HC2 domain-containing protein [Deltaproteobacteria bacterium]|nr:zf-HC2 domain-containing protein [Deltaproteobacteria bacterium]
MECERVRELLSEYIDGLLDQETRALVEEHLSSCEGCREELASLEALVEELGSLEPVRAPGDFLERLHERIEARFTLGKLIRVLFVPVRIKVPLEAATALAIAILVLGGLYTYRPKEQIASAPRVSTQEWASKGAAADKLGPAPKREASRYQPALEERPAERPGREAEPIELVFLLGEKPPGTGHAAGGAVRVPMGEAFESKEREVAPSSRLDGLLLKVKSLIKDVRGRVVSVEHDRKTGEPRSILAEIPSKSYQSFYRELERLAPVQAPGPGLSEGGEGPLQVRIRFLRPR